MSFCWYFGAEQVFVLSELSLSHPLLSPALDASELLSHCDGSVPPHVTHFWGGLEMGLPLVWALNL